MSVIFALQNIASFARLKFDRPVAPPVQPPPPPVQNRAELLQARDQLLDVFRALDAVAEAMNVKTRRFKLDLPDARSDPSLALSLAESAAFLASNDEINASPHSFSTKGPDWTSGSTALLTIGGDYDGTNGNTTFNFNARRGGIRGINNLQIRVEDSSGQSIGNFNIQRNDPLDQRYDLGNGLYFTLGDGLLVDPDTTSVDLFQNVGSVVNPDNPLGGTRAFDPNFQYYPAPDTLAPVQDGSFDLNGMTISVSTTDTINTVIDRINESGAGVTATYNATSERIEFTQNTVGATPTIEIQNDTSNFVVATKLDSAVVTPGTDSDLNLAVGDVTSLSGISAGTALINGSAIGVDPATDSLSDVIDAVNTSGAGVTASFDPATRAVTIESDAEATTLEIDSNGTGLFAALNIPEGRVDPEVARGGISKRRSYEIAEAVDSMAKTLNALFNDSAFTDRGSSVRGARTAIASLFASTIESSSIDGDTLFGLAFDQSASGAGRGRVAEVDIVDFARQLQLRGDPIKDVFVGPDQDKGLIGRLFDVTLNSLRNLNRQLGISGDIIDTFA